MNVIKRTALTRYSQRQMFDLVNNVEDYARFLPWCKSSKIIHNDEKKVEAMLEVAWSGIHKHFTTRNYLSCPDAIQITLVEGPFRHFEGKWHFIPLEGHQCRVNLELEFELTGRLLDRLFEPVFHYMANSLVELFCQHAVEIYGER
jgi:ribosome-associated toxin RatA of RatAB toxin-antitoxin module